MLSTHCNPVTHFPLGRSHWHPGRTAESRRFWQSAGKRERVRRAMIRSARRRAHGRPGSALAVRQAGRDRGRFGAPGRSACLRSERGPAGALVRLGALAVGAAFASIWRCMLLGQHAARRRARGLPQVGNTPGSPWACHPGQSTWSAPVPPLVGPPHRRGRASRRSPSRLDVATGLAGTTSTAITGTTHPPYRRSASGAGAAPNGACALWHTTGDPPGHATSNGKPRRYLTFPLDDFRHTTSASLRPGARNARRADRKPVSAPTASLDTSHRSHRRGPSPGHRKHSPDRGADWWRRDIRSWRR